MKIPAREVTQYVHDRVGRMRALYPHLHINSHDWEDMIQDITVHVAGKWRQHHGDTWKGWVSMITRNQVVNKIRNRIRDYRKMPMVGLTSRIEQDDYLGEEEIVYEPDMATPEDGVDKTRAALIELTGQHKTLVDEFVEQGTWDKTRKRVGLNTNQLARLRGEMAAQVRSMI